MLEFRWTFMREGSGWCVSLRQSHKPKRRGYVSVLSITSGMRRGEAVTGFHYGFWMTVALLVIQAWWKLSRHNTRWCHCQFGELMVIDTCLDSMSDCFPEISDPLTPVSPSHCTSTIWGVNKCIKKINNFMYIKIHHQLKVFSISSFIKKL